MYIVFSKPNCHQCETAMSLLRGTGDVQYEVKKIGVDATLEDAFEMISKTSSPNFAPRSMPIIFKKSGDTLKVFETFAEFENEFLVI